jgi:hypothetical protein
MQVLRESVKVILDMRSVNTAYAGCSLRPAGHACELGSTVRLTAVYRLTFTSAVLSFSAPAD